MVSVNGCSDIDKFILLFDLINMGKTSKKETSPCFFILTRKMRAADMQVRRSNQLLVLHQKFLTLLWQLILINSFCKSEFNPAVFIEPLD